LKITASVVDPLGTPKGFLALTAPFDWLPEPELLPVPELAQEASIPDAGSSAAAAREPRRKCRRGIGVWGMVMSWVPPAF
jgi:hypothetical protein